MDNKKIKFIVLKEEILGIQTYRGSGKLSDIARISQADVFDEQKNPTGTQRGLKLQHARSAYDYVTKNPFCFWPEVILSCRNSDVINFEIRDQELNSGTLYVDIVKLKKYQKRKKIPISRVDGNHRLHFADGTEDGFDPIDKKASFCLLMDLTPEKEIQLFRDINNNLERMPTSHLDYITVRLTPDEQLKRDDPSLYIAQKLDEDTESPFYKRVSKTGKKNVDRDIPLRSLHTGIQYMRSNTKDLQTLSGGNIDIEYLVIKNYFLALKEWKPEAWTSPKDFLLLRGSGFWGACFLGGVVIDRCLSDGKWEVGDMLNIIKSGKNWDWSNKGDFKQLGGRGGAKQISELIKQHLPTKTGISMLAIREKIISQS